MTRLVTTPARSALMARIRSRGNRSTELRMARLLRDAGITGWRRHVRLPGTPDFAFPKVRVAVFVDGCFWHGCPEHWRPPKSNREFWVAKVERNRRRDREADDELGRMGWVAHRVWEHELRRSPGTVAHMLWGLIMSRLPVLKAGPG